MQRIFLLPKNIIYPDDLEHDVELDVVYAPVSRHSVPKELQDQAIEAWIPRGNPTSQSSSHSSSSTISSELRNHHHQRRHHRRHSSRYRSDSPSSLTGTIKLELSSDEGLLPGYAPVSRAQKMCWWGNVTRLLLSDISKFHSFPSSYFRAQLGNWPLVKGLKFFLFVYLCCVQKARLDCSIFFSDITIAPYNIEPERVRTWLRIFAIYHRFAMSQTYCLLHNVP